MEMGGAGDTVGDRVVAAGCPSDVVLKKKEKGGVVVQGRMVV